MLGRHPQSSRRSGRGDLYLVSIFLKTWGRFALTTRDHHPDEVHEEEIEPKVICLGPTVLDILMVEIKHTGGVVENQSVDLAEGDNGLDWVAVWVRDSDEVGGDERQWSPASLL